MYIGCKFGQKHFTGERSTYVYPVGLKVLILVRSPGDMQDRSDQSGTSVCFALSSG